MPRNIKRILIIVFICIGIISIFIYSLDLHKTSDRPWGDASIPKELKELATNRTEGKNKAKDIMKECSTLTTDYLSFSRANNIPNGEANCIGYAQLASALLNQSFRQNNLNCQAKPVVGTVHSFGINLNTVAQHILPSSWRPFFKDHDFVEVTTDEGVFFIDTSLQDITNRNFILKQSK